MRADSIRGYVLSTRIVWCKACCSMLPALCINPGNLPSGPRSAGATGVGTTSVESPWATSKPLELPGADDESEALGVGHCPASGSSFLWFPCCLK